MKIKKANRPSKHKDKKSSGCAMCKPHKHGWVPAVKEKKRKILNEKLKTELEEVD